MFEAGAADHRMECGKDGVLCRLEKTSLIPISKASCNTSPAIMSVITLEDQEIEKVWKVFWAIMQSSSVSFGSVKRALPPKSVELRASEGSQFKVAPPVGRGHQDA